MTRGLIIGVIITLLIVVGAGVYFLMPSNVTENERSDNSNSNSQISSSQSPAGATVEITASGFSPQEVKIRKGGSVTWVNKWDRNAWPASAVHPIHTAYPGASYDEAGSYEGSEACRGRGLPKTGAFDSCKELAPSESYSFTFNQMGSWAYHDHINSGRFGKVVVE